MEIKDLRKTKNLTQVEASNITKIPLRTFKLYENDKSKKGTIKYQYIMNSLSSYNEIDEEHGILDLSTIKNICNDIFKKYDVDYAILFGSYAKGTPSGKSDVDIFISTKITGLKYFGLVEELRTALNKKIDLLNQDQLIDNFELTNEILKWGIKIYGPKGFGISKKN